ncbi:MAG TPA: SigE family RNA polymerase sigma factor [Acidimicrobiales bacterium]|nr:SigE family RNA polymerase sigma factor [Acidimicrobiales bacterium]
MPDEESFGRYVMEAYPALLRRARLLVGDAGHAEDLVQLALASAFTHWRTVRQPDAYLRTVMARKAIGWRARRWHGELPTDPLPDSADGSVQAGDFDLGGAVRQALMTLPAEQRAVVVLRYFDDCSEADIAAALKCSPGTVKSRASRALAALRASGLLAEEGQMR